MNGGIKHLSDELIRKLMLAGLTKQQATSVTAETITNLYMNEDSKILIAEAKHQIDEMQVILNSLKADYYSLKGHIDAISDNVLSVMAAQNEFGTITDEKAKNVIALYSAILSMNGKRGVDPNEAVKNASFVLYAFLGGQAKREITYLSETDNRIT